MSMTMQSLKYPQEEFARRGQAWYETLVRSQVDPDHQGEIVAIDVDTGEFELGENTLSAAKRLLARLPDSQMWFVRVGHIAVYRIGFAGSTLEA
jgi:hypothetical protein